MSQELGRIPSPMIKEKNTTRHLKLRASGRRGMVIGYNTSPLILSLRLIDTDDAVDVMLHEKRL
jgi:hypothetical protein